jgi:hypothetical protein
MNTSERIKPGAKPINSLAALSGIKYQQLQTQKSRSRFDGFRKDVRLKSLSKNIDDFIYGKKKK